MTYYRNRNRNRYTAPEPVVSKTPLLDAAIAASEKRNQLNYSIVSDCGPDVAQRMVNHYSRLIELVNEAVMAWKAYRASIGEEYGTNPSNTPHDVGWLPRYQEELMAWKLKAAKQAAKAGK